MFRLLTPSNNQSRSLPPQHDRKGRFRDRSPYESNEGSIPKKDAQRPPIPANSQLVCGSKTPITSADANSFRVYVRTRPLNNKEINVADLGKAANIVRAKGNTVNKKGILWFLCE